jgi:hypothetical protein
MAIRDGNKCLCTLLHRMLHYSTLQTQFPTSNFHSLYIIRYQYDRNNTQTARGDRPQGTVREKAGLALSFSRQSAWNLYCLLFTMPFANFSKGKGYITLCFAVLPAVGREPCCRVAVTSAHCPDVNALPLAYITRQTASRISIAGWRRTPGYASRSSLLAYLPHIAHYLRLLSHFVATGDPPPFYAHTLSTSLPANVRIPSFVACNALSSNRMLVPLLQLVTPPTGSNLTTSGGVGWWMSVIAAILWRHRTPLAPNLRFYKLYKK